MELAVASSQMTSGRVSQTGLRDFVIDETKRKIK